MSNSGDQNIHNNAPNYGNQGIFHVTPIQDINIGNCIHRTHTQKLSAGRWKIKLNHVIFLLICCILAMIIVSLFSIFKWFTNPSPLFLKLDQTSHSQSLKNPIWTFAPIVVFFIIFSTSLPLISDLLRDLRIFRITPLLQIYLELGDDGVIYRTKIEGNCPKCKNKLYIRRSKSGNNMKIRCNRSHNHQWDFDNTFLKDVSEEDIS